MDAELKIEKIKKVLEQEVDKKFKSCKNIHVNYMLNSEWLRKNLDVFWDALIKIYTITYDKKELKVTCPNCKKYDFSTFIEENESIIEGDSLCNECGGKCEVSIIEPMAELIYDADYENIQEELWKKADELYREGGLRNSTLSGRICESLLIKRLRGCLNNLNFNTGQIILKDTSEVENEKEMSSQLDIIAYKEEPHKKGGDIVSVWKKDVRAIIEVKRWVYPSNIESYKNQLEKIKKELKEGGLNEEIPIFLVVFFSGKSISTGGGKELVQKEIPNFKCYIFCKAMGSKEEDKKSYDGEFKRLVKDIKGI